MPLQPNGVVNAGAAVAAAAAASAAAASTVSAGQSKAMTGLSLQVGRCVCVRAYKVTLSTFLAGASMHMCPLGGMRRNGKILLNFSVFTDGQYGDMINIRIDI